MKPIHITINIDKQLKKDFKKKCLENDTEMTKVLIEFIKKYIKGE